MNSQEYVVRKLGGKGKTNQEIADFCSVELDYVDSILGSNVEEPEEEEPRKAKIAKK